MGQEENKGKEISEQENENQNNSNSAVVTLEETRMMKIVKNRKMKIQI